MEARATDDASPLAAGDLADRDTAALNPNLPVAGEHRPTPVAPPSSSARAAASSRAGRALKHLGQSLLVPAIILLLWEVVSSPRTKESNFVKSRPALAARLPKAQVLPPPSQVLRRWVEYAQPTETWERRQENLSEAERASVWKRSRLRWALSGELWGDTLSSLWRVVVGFVIGGGLALPLGLFMGANALGYRLFNPVVQVLRPIPPIAYIPLSILWFGLGNPPAYFLISLGAFFPVLVNTIAGVRNVDGIYLRAARNLGARGFTLFWRVILPAATPYILTGMRVGIGVAFIVVIVAELIAVNQGLGYRIMEAREFFWSDKIIAGMISIGLLGLALDTLMDRLNAHLLRWHRGADAPGGGH